MNPESARIYRDSMPATPGAFTEMVRPDCYHQIGSVFCKGLPDFVKPEDVRHEVPRG